MALLGEPNEPSIQLCMQLMDRQLAIWFKYINVSDKSSLAQLCKDGYQAKQVSLLIHIIMLLYMNKTGLASQA